MMNFDSHRLWSRTKEAAKKAGELAKDVLTAGGYSALNKSIAAYNEKLDEHSRSVRRYEDANADFRRAVESLGQETSDCVSLLRDANDLVQRLSYSGCSSSIPNMPQFETPDLSHVTATLSNFDAAITAGKGAGLGVAASTGAWVLVAHLGTASTGAAISGLGGIAAHNAVLAWFGGGALAAGGGGMVLGGLAIGAIALVPMIGYSAYKSYKEARRIDAEAVKTEASGKSNSENAAKLGELRTAADDLRLEVAQHRVAFLDEFRNFKTEARQLAERTAASANSFADKLVLISDAKGATA